MKKDSLPTHKISAIAGVSPATVSRAVNHPELVKKETLEKIEHAIAELGLVYEPNQAPEEKAAKTVLVSFPPGNNPFYEQVFQGITASASSHGYHVLISYSPLNGETLEEYIHYAETIPISGLILSTYLGEKELSRLEKAFPIVQCSEYNGASDAPFVSIDDREAAANAVRHLITSGRNKVAILNGPQQFKYSRERLDGYLQAMNEAGLSAPSSWIMQIPEINYEMAFAVAGQLLSSDARPNAVFAVSDILAAAVINAAGKHGLRVPEDIMVVGFDDLQLCRIITPTLTSVRQPGYQIGFTAGEQLAEQIQNPASHPRSALLGTELIVRESTQ